MVQEKQRQSKMLLGLLTPNEGSITWDGKPFGTSGVTIGYLPEERGLYTKVE